MRKGYSDVVRHAQSPSDNAQRRTETAQTDRRPTCSVDVRQPQQCHVSFLIALIVYLIILITH